MVTLRDVARKADVSPATASLALNNSNKVSRKTLKKVQGIARKMNYIPDARARALACKKTRIIGLVIPDIKNPFYSELAQIIKNAAKRSQYNIILCGVESEEDELDYIKMFRGMQVDGAIFTCSHRGDHNADLISELAQNYIPVVYIDRTGNDDDIVPVIKSNLQDAAYKAVEHLTKLGHRRIGFAGKENGERTRGFFNAVKYFKLEVDENNCFYNTLFFKDGYDLGKKLIKRGNLPTGIVCHNDEVAMGLIQYLIKSGIEVPRDISVCGIDNIVLSHFYNPSLTTIDLPIKEMGEKAVELLLKMIDGQKPSIEEIYIRYPVQLIVRDSTDILQGSEV